MLIDLHAKSQLSEGVTLSIEEVLDRASEKGLDAVAFTETMSTAAAQSAIDAGKKRDMLVFIGVEIPTDRGILLGFLPTIDGYYLNEEWRELTEYTTPAIEDVIEEFVSRGGAVVAARPYDLEIPYNMGDTIFRVDQLSGIEVFNANVGELQNDFALEASRFLGIATVGGSDPRGEAKGLGVYATLFLEDIETQAELVEAIKRQEFWALQLGEIELEQSSLNSNIFDRKERREDSRGGRRGGGGGRSRGGRDSDRGKRRDDSGSKGGGDRRRSRDRSRGDRDNASGDRGRSRRRGNSSRGRSRNRS